MAEAPTPICTDALVIGAGPVGLFQVFQLGLLDIRTHVVDALPHAGGQPGELYPDKFIFDIPAVPMITGRGLTDALLKQVEPFAPEFHFGQEVSQLARRADGAFDVATSGGLSFIAKTVFIAAGVGAFKPRTLAVEGLAAFEGRQLFHRLPEAALAGQRVLIVGDGDEAIDAALALGQPGAAQSVTLMHRRDAFKATPDRLEALTEARAQNRVHFVAAQAVGIEAANGELTALSVLDSEGQTRPLSVDTLLVLQGLSPKLGPIADWGLKLARKQLEVDTEKFQTDMPGIFAVGDINTYPGKKKLIVSGFHECALAAFGAAPIVYPERPVQLQYTTTSTRLHKLLGVNPPAAD